MAKWHYFQGKKFFIGELYLFKPAWFSNCGEFAITKIRIVNTLAQNKKNLCPDGDRDSWDMVKPIGLLHVDNGQTVRGGTLYALTSSLVDDDATGGEVFGHHVGTGLRQLVVELLVTLG